MFTSGGGGGGGSGKFKAPQYGLTAAPPSSSYAPPPRPRPPLDPAALKRVGAQKGSNPGGTFENAAGERFYVKKGHSNDHVREELTAAALARLTGASTLRYRPVEGGAHVATEIAKLDKDNANKLSPDEIAELRKDFATHAWLANWDVAGLGGDNVGTIAGRPTALDLGGALSYRAQGAAKGKAFGNHVGEITSLRDKTMNRDAAKLFATMSPAELRESARYVTDVKDGEIRSAVAALGGAPALAEKMIARRDNIAEQARRFGAANDVSIFNKGEKAHGYQAWEPPQDWANVEGQAAIDEPPLPEGKHVSTGVIMKEPDGRYWMMRPTGGFGGYEHTFPKGGMEAGLSPQANAIKETYEETGLKANILKHLGDFEGDTGVSRYYLGERAGGDPTQHGWESDGVVLAPKSKLAGFLNRPRDQKIAAGLDAALAAADAWEESEHPRATAGSTAGQFVKKGEGGGAGATPEDLEEGLAEIESEIDENELVAAAAAAKANPAAWAFFQTDLPEKAAKIAHLMGEKEESTFSIVDKIEELVDGGFHGAALELANKHPKVLKVINETDPQLAGELGIAEESPLPEFKAGAPATAVAQLSTQDFVKNVASITDKPAIAGANYRRVLMKMLKESKNHNDAGAPILKQRLIESWQKTHANFVKKGDLTKASKVAKTLAKLGVVTVTKVPPLVAPQHEAAAATQAAAKAASEAKKHADFAAIQAQKEQEPPAAFPPPSEAELAKAKKSVALQLQYVPGASELSQAGQKEAQKLIGEFNKEYEGKTITDVTALATKVNAFKTLAHKVAALGKIDAVQKAKEQADAAAKAKEAAAKAAVEQKAAAQEAKAKNAAAMRQLGISEQEAEGFNALVQMMGGNQADVISTFKHHEATAKQYGYPITGFQAALIRNYTGSGYSAVNKALRSGSYTVAQSVYRSLMNKALRAMPTYTGTVKRGTSLDAAGLAKLVPGNVVPEHGFTSTSITSPWAGNVKYTIKAIGKNGAHVKKLSSHPSEDEVVFAAGTRFLIKNVSTTASKAGEMMHVEMEELED